MLVKGLRLRSFGKFVDSENTELNKGINIVYGKNEAGKTTLYNALQTLLYGFNPTNVEKHPYASYGLNTIDISGIVVDSMNKEIVVERRLLSTPRASYFMDDKKYNLKNEPVPKCGHITKAMYKGLYTLKLEDINGLDGGLWDNIEDRLLSNYGIVGITNPRDIVVTINKELDKLYKQTRKGKSLIREKRLELQDLFKQKAGIKRKEEELRELDRENEGLKVKLSKSIGKREEISNKIYLIDRLMPIKRNIDELEILEEKHKGYSKYCELPQDISDRYASYKKNLEGLLEEKRELTLKIDSLGHRKETLEVSDSFILDNIKNIQGLIRRLDIAESKRDIKLNKQIELRKITKAINDDIYNIFHSGIGSNLHLELKELNRIVIFNNIKKITGDKKILQEYILKYNLLSNQEKSIKLNIVYPISIALSSLMLLGRYLNQSILIYLGVIFGVVGCFGLFNYIMMNRYSNSSDIEHRMRLEKEIKRVKESIVKHNNDLRDAFKNVPIKTQMIEHMDEELGRLIFTIRELLEDREFILSELDGMEKDEQCLKDDIQKLLKKCDIEDMGSNHKDIYELNTRYEYILQRMDNNREIDLEIKDLSRRLKDILEQIREKKEYISSVDRIFKDVGVNEGFTNVKEMYRIRHAIDLLKDKLYQIDNREEELRLLKNLDFDIDDEFKKKQRIELEKISASIKNDELRMARIDERLKNYQGERLDDIESQIMILKDELDSDIKYYDKYRVISEFIRLTDRKFKEANQPDIIKKASYYFRTMTGGRYENIYLDTTEGKVEVLLKSSNESQPIKDVYNLSKGTLNQLYLSIRLGIIDSLEGKKECLPIIFDELFSNWDDERLNETLNLLKQISNVRQIILFTCNPWMKERFEDIFEIESINI